MTRAMKDSGIEWIGQIPENYTICKVKNIFKIGRGRVIAQTELKDNGLYPVYSSQTLNNGCMGYINTYDFDKPQLTWTTDGANAGTVFLRTGKYNCTNVCGTLSPITKICNLSYMLYNISYIAFFHKRIDTNGYKIMNNEMGNIEILLPPLTEQKKIADYLDKRCEKIDTAIDNQKQIIEKLKEYKQSLITETVTKGLNPNVKMKDSGIEWIGSIPEHWAVRKLRYLFSCQNGISKSGEYFGKGFPFVSYGDVYKNNIIPENVSQLCETNEEERERYSVKKGDIFYTRTSETIEEIGLTSICYQDIKDATFAGFLIRVRPTTQLLEIGFSKYYTSSNMHRRFFVKEMNLVTRASLSQELLKRLPILLPPIDEQQKIAEYLDKKCNQIDVAIKQKEETISKLEEYKKSLIFECVTGKKEVA